MRASLRPKRSFVAAVALSLLTLAGVLPASLLAATIIGTPKNDILRGTAKADKLYGKGGNDRLYGGAGNDLLVGGPGIDRFFCGTGRDRVLADSQDITVFKACEIVSRVADPTPPVRERVDVYCAIGIFVQQSLSGAGFCAEIPTDDWTVDLLAGPAAKGGANQLPFQLLQELLGTGRRITDIYGLVQMPCTPDSTWEFTLRSKGETPIQQDPTFNYEDNSGGELSGSYIKGQFDTTSTPPDSARGVMHVVASFDNAGTHYDCVLDVDWTAKRVG